MKQENSMLLIGIGTIAGVVSLIIYKNKKEQKRITEFNRYRDEYYKKNKIINTIRYISICNKALQPIDQSNAKIVLDDLKLQMDGATTKATFDMLADQLTELCIDINLSPKSAVDAAICEFHDRREQEKEASKRAHERYLLEQENTHKERMLGSVMSGVASISRPSNPVININNKSEDN